LTSADTVRDGLIVIFHYTLRDDEGTVIDASGSDAMPYLHGANNIVSGLERQLAGRAVGDRIAAVVQPEDGYGAYQDALVLTVPRDAFPPGADIQVGMSFLMNTDEGDRPVWVTAVEPSMITVDGNHPMAGRTLHFDIEIVGLRQPTAEELAHGHPHGPDGTHSHGH